MTELKIEWGLLVEQAIGQADKSAMNLRLTPDITTDESLKDALGK